MRRALNEFLIDTVSKNSKVIFITGDLGFGVFDEFQKKFPSNYINAGIAESNMVAVACGLAAEGFTPIVYSIASFMTSRPYEFIKILSGYNQFPIIIIGAGGGLSYAKSGGTHHALDDLGLMLGIPNMQVFTPAGPTELKNLLSKSIFEKKSSYFRIGKFGEIDVTDGVNSPAELIRGHKIALLSHSNITFSLLEVAKKINSEHTEILGLYHFSSIRPLNNESVKIIVENYEYVVIVEEHWTSGSLYSEILFLVNDLQVNSKIFRLGPPNKFIHEIFDEVNLRKKFGYASDDVVKFINDLVK
jgi:transketolase